MENKIERKKIDKWDAIVCTTDNEVCISLHGEGGAIISANSYCDAETKFIEAMNLCEVVNQLLHFSKHGRFKKIKK